MATREVEVALTIKVRLHIDHGYYATNEKQLVRKAKADIAAHLGRRMSRFHGP